MIELYYENYILINTDTPNFEDIKKKYFDNEGNKIVLLKNNYSIQSPFKYFTPVMFADLEGYMLEWLKWTIGIGVIALSIIAIPFTV